jgi:hypothetical protein
MVTLNEAHKIHILYTEFHSMIKEVVRGGLWALCHQQLQLIREDRYSEGTRNFQSMILLPQLTQYERWQHMLGACI